jgi:hypothetical protein
MLTVYVKPPPKLFSRNIHTPVTPVKIARLAFLDGAVRSEQTRFIENAKEVGLACFQSMGHFLSIVDGFRPVA